jgi:hypothetical protein
MLAGARSASARWATYSARVSAVAGNTVRPSVAHQSVNIDQARA